MKVLKGGSHLILESAASLANACEKRCMDTDHLRGEAETGRRNACILLPKSSSADVGEWREPLSVHGCSGPSPRWPSLANFISRINRFLLVVDCRRWRAINDTIPSSLVHNHHL